MSLSKLAVSAVALSLMTGAAFAQSNEPATSVGCLHMQKKVSAALDANASSANYAEARKQAQGAQAFCTWGMYQNGLHGYAKALQLLGAS